MSKRFDVLVIGAGLSGIGMACHLARECPEKSFAVLERRKAIGGTWDLFRYPGIRSDSDMFSFGFSFRPWNDLKVLADGPSIRQYVADTAREFGVDQKVHFGLKVTEANWVASKAEWQLTALREETGETETWRCRFLIMGTGYYNYDAGFLPSFKGAEQFRGQRIHPQHWPETLDYRGKRVVVIGSGATAVTLVPAMAEKAGHVTMLQRSPSYIFSVPAFDAISQTLSRVLPARWVYHLARERNIKLQRLIYKVAKRNPKLVRRLLLAQVRRNLGPEGDISHFSPRYNPWDERLCAVPDADLFKAIRSGKASVVTDEIERFTETGLQLKSGKTLNADIVVTATGLNVQVLGGMKLLLDGKAAPLNELMSYKGVMAQNIPNFAWIFGYTNAPWTLKADIAAGYLCRLLRHMDKTGKTVAVARDVEGGNTTSESVMSELGSGYIKRADPILPRQGKKLPWRVLNQYEVDKPLLLKAPIEDGVLQLA